MNNKIWGMVVIILLIIGILFVFSSDVFNKSTMSDDGLNSTNLTKNINNSNETMFNNSNVNSNGNNNGQNVTKSSKFTNTLFNKTNATQDAIDGKKVKISNYYNGRSDYNYDKYNKHNKSKNNYNNTNETKSLTKKEAFNAAKKSSDLEYPFELKYKEAKFYDDGYSQYWRFNIYNKAKKSYEDAVYIDVVTGNTWSDWR